MAHMLKPTSIDGVFEIQTDIFNDQRGSFINFFRSSEKAFKNCWFDKEIKQVNLSKNSFKGTLRGLHYQLNPYAEKKMVRCIKGCVWDVAVDLREDSSTYLSWHCVELSPKFANAIVIPEGCAHGFQVLEEDSEILYLHSGDWIKESETGIRWNDPQIAISWPLQAVNLSERDQNLPYLSEK
ncbi:dTDP-4-dehydrorhamnose 3,5-epimerase [Prochlorococcus marinus]|nr:dTDP-4-dehydrorhamnose 3,5-epimerase [Prochlorococcus marinus]